MMDTGAGASADSAGVEESRLNPSSSNRGDPEATSTLIDPIQPEKPVTPRVSTTCNLAGDAAAKSSSSTVTAFGGGETHAKEKPMPGVIGAQGIIKFACGDLYTSVIDNIEGVLRFRTVFVDSFPSEDDESWVPPVHGEDVASLPDDLVEELDEKRHDYTQFKRILDAQGCQSSGIEEDFLLCFEKERELQHSETGRDNRQGTEVPLTPEKAGLVSPMKSTVSAFFHFSRDEGRIVRPGAEELERCLTGIPDEPHGEWKNLLKSLNDEAVGAVENSDWNTACEQYEASLLLLENMESSIGVHVETWLLLWLCLPLLDMYQLRLRNYPRCVRIYDQVLQQLNREMNSLASRNQKGKAKVGESDEDPEEDEHEALILLYYSIIWHRRLILFEWSYTFEKDENQLLASYVRSKVFSKIRKIHFPGFVQLQRMVNYWGRRTGRGREGDMRVALCFNLEHLYRESKQHLKALEWTREKWRWIRDETHKPEDQWNLKLGDVMHLFIAGMTQEAKSIIDDLEAIRTILPPSVSDSIDEMKAKFLMQSGRPKEAEQPLRKLRRRLEKQKEPDNDQSSAAERNEVLARVQWDLSRLNSNLREAEMLEHTPFGVEMIDWSDENDSGAISLMKEDELANASKQALPGSISESKIYLTHGKRLLDSLGKRFPVEKIETYRERLHAAVKSFEDALSSIEKIEDALQIRDKVISHEEIVDTQRRISRHRIICYESLGVCCAYAHQLKPRGVKYNVEDFQSELPVYDEACLDKGIEHLERSLDLAQKNGHDDDDLTIIPRILAKLGWIHFAKVKEYDDRVRKFMSLAPEFSSQYLVLDETSRIETSLGSRQLAVERDCGNPRHVHVYVLHLGTYELLYGHMQKTSTDRVDAFARLGFLRVGGYRRGFGLSEEYLTDEDMARTLKHCAGLLLRGLMVEIKRSSQYIQRSLEMGRGRILTIDTSSSGKNLVPSLSMVETTKKFFTLLQRLMVYEQNVRQVIKDDGLLQNLVTTPETAEYLRNQPDDLTPSQKALLWAERGRSRSLMHQLLIMTNKLPEEPINNMVNFDMTDQEAWAVLRETQFSCGENTVFVEYTFDATHEFVSDLKGSQTGKKPRDWKSCNWIVYVVTKEGEVHMRSYQSKIPEVFVKNIHTYLSEGGDAKMVERNLEELYNAFIRPIYDLLHDMKPEDNLVFALDEVLTNVPFAILRNSDTGKYLFENHTISFTPALRVLMHCEQRHISLQASPTVEPSVALGDPAYPPDDFECSRLKHTYREAKNIPPLFNDGSVKVLTGTNATADNLLTLAKLPVDTVQGFVHVAAHGFVNKNHKSGSLQLAYSSVEQDPPSPDSSSPRADDYDTVMELEESTLHNMTDDFGTLEVGRREPRRGRKAKAEEAMAKEKSCLRSEKIMQCGFEWRSYMVVLSACNSAKGLVLGSEGVVGLPRAFLVAGVPCIIASQWSLEDKSSSELMREFYREMSQGRDAASALRAAMLRQMHCHPDVGSSDQQADVYKWGGYLVWGTPAVTLPPSMLIVDEKRTRHAG